MIRGLLKQLKARLKLDAAKNGAAGDLDPGEKLKVSATTLWCLARQIEAHSAQAPYPHLAKRLQEIALEKQKMVDFLKEELSHLGKDFGQPQSTIKSGKNHWERMRQDVEDQKSLEANLLMHAAHLAESAPKISDLLKNIASQQSAHSDILLNMLIRADPQANQT